MMNDDAWRIMLLMSAAMEVHHESSRVACDATNHCITKITWAMDPIPASNISRKNPQNDAPHRNATSIKQLDTADYCWARWHVTNRDKQHMITVYIYMCFDWVENIATNNE